jgi:tRNA pseudouridine55 synthase
MMLSLKEACKLTAKQPMLSGFLNINKPLGLTSHDVVARVRRIYKRDTGSKKVGHAGTLDPLATGVLIVCVGQATRLSDYVMHSTKAYRAQLQLGATTDTYDAEGNIITTTDASHITLDAVKAILPQFIGHIQQVPPMYSAIKIGGKKLYDLARAGQEIERPARDVYIEDISIEAWRSPQLTLSVTCASGTYIRSLAHDIGQALGVGAHLTALARLRSGDFQLDHAVELESLLDDPEWHHALITPKQALQAYPSLTLSSEEAQAIQHGRIIPYRDAHNAEGIAMAYLEDDHLLAIVEASTQGWHPKKVFHPQA